METIIATIVIELLKNVAATVGQGLGSRVLELIAPPMEASGKKDALRPILEGTSGAVEEDLVKEELAAQMRKDPAFAGKAAEAVNADLAERPDLIGLLASIPQHLFGLSKQQVMVQDKSRCPVGGEPIWLPPRYFNDDGTEIQGGAFKWWSSLPRTAVAQCRDGHRWPVFAIKVGTAV